MQKIKFLAVFLSEILLSQSVASLTGMQIDSF